MIAMASTFDEVMASLKHNASEAFYFEDGSSRETEIRTTTSDNYFGDTSSNDVDSQVVVEKVERVERLLSPPKSSRSLASDTSRTSDASLDTSASPRRSARRKTTVLEEIREEIGRHSGAGRSSVISPTRSPTRSPTTTRRSVSPTREINGHVYPSFIEELTQKREVHRTEVEFIDLSEQEPGTKLKGQLQAVLEEQVPQTQSKLRAIRQVPPTPVDWKVKSSATQQVPRTEVDWQVKAEDPLAKQPHADEGFLSQWPFLKEQFQFFSSELVQIRSELARVEESSISERSALRAEADSAARGVEERFSELREDFKRRLAAATEESYNSPQRSPRAPNFQAELREYKREAQAYADRVGHDAQEATEAARRRVSEDIGRLATRTDQSLADLLRQLQSQEERLYAAVASAERKVDVQIADALKLVRSEIQREMERLIEKATTNFIEKTTTSQKPEFSTRLFDELREQQDDAHNRHRQQIEVVIGQDRTKIMNQFEDIESTLHTLRSDLEEETKLRIANDDFVRDTLSIEKSERLAGDAENLNRLSAALVKLDSGVAEFRDLMAGRFKLLSGKLDQARREPARASTFYIGES